MGRRGGASQRRVDLAQLCRRRACNVGDQVEMDLAIGRRGVVAKGRRRVPLEGLVQRVILLYIRLGLVDGNLIARFPPL